MSDTGAQCAIRERIAERRAWLYRMAMVWTGDPARADDLVQETRVRCLSRSADLRDDQRLDPWLFAVLKNCWRDSFRDRWRNKVELDDQALADGEGPAQTSDRDQAVARVHRAVDSLPEGQKAVVLRVDIQGYSYAEVAAELSIPVGTVMSRLCRARQRLAELLSEARPGTPDGGKVARFRRVR